MQVEPYTTLRAWVAEVSRLRRLMRCSSPHFRRFDATARQLSPRKLRAETDAELLEGVAFALRGARYHSGHLVHDLNRVWTREELGELISAAEGRAAQLRLGRLDPKPKGPTLDPRRIPDHRLDALIQRHRDLTVVEACRAERARRLSATQMELF